MITENDLLEAIAECQGVRNPRAETCVKLAAYYTLLDHLYGDKREAGPIPAPAPAYSYAAHGPARIANYGMSEFAQMIEGREPDDVWPIMEELMRVLQAANPRLYNGVMRQLED